MRGSYCPNFIGLEDDHSLLAPKFSKRLLSPVDKLPPPTEKQSCSLRKQFSYISTIWHKFLTISKLNSAYISSRWCTTNTLWARNERLASFMLQFWVCARRALGRGEGGIFLNKLPLPRGLKSLADGTLSRIRDEENISKNAHHPRHFCFFPPQRMWTILFYIFFFYHLIHLRGTVAKHLKNTFQSRTQWKKGRWPQNSVSSSALHLVGIHQNIN